MDPNWSYPAPQPQPAEWMMADPAPQPPQPALQPLAAPAASTFPAAFVGAAAPADPAFTIAAAITAAPTTLEAPASPPPHDPGELAGLPLLAVERILRHRLTRPVSRSMHRLRDTPPTPEATARGGPDYRASQRPVWRYANLQVQYVEAVMLQVRSAPHVGAACCGRCQRGLGPFESCVASPHYFGGVCACCWFSRANKLCSFHRKHSCSHVPHSPFPLFLFSSRLPLAPQGAQAFMQV